MANPTRSPHQTYLNIAWVLTLVLVVWAITVGNTGIPSWTIAIPAVVTGFWWAFGRGFVGASPNGDGDADGAGRG